MDKELKIDNAITLMLTQNYDNHKAWKNEKQGPYHDWAYCEECRENFDNPTCNNTIERKSFTRTDWYHVKCYREVALQHYWHD